MDAEKSKWDVERLAWVLYEKYCMSVGGKAVNGDLLPDWRTFRADRRKQIQSDAWVEVAKKAIALIGENDP